MNLGYDSDKTWPIFIESQGEARAIPLGPGDGLLYRGIDLPHWRDQFDGQQAVQAFLHYVDQDGPHREWRYDKRAGLATSSLAIKLVTEIAELDSAKN